MSNSSNNFRYNSPYKSSAVPLGVRFGFDKPLMEVELNELQDIQNELRGKSIRNILPSGFLELVAKNFSGTPIIYKPVDTFNSVLNSIAIAPAKAIINGMIVDIYGNFTADDGEGYTLIDLGDPPSSGIREDLVFLEVWAEKVSSSDSFPKQGFVKGVTTKYQIVDSRVGSETSWRMVLRYNIRVVHNVNFDLFPNGLGYINANSFSPIQALANDLTDSINNNLVFRPASDLIFKDCTFYKDYNLYVAGRPDYTLVSDSIIGRYVFALPMFHISRKNTQPYSLSNFNGARSSIFRYGEANSSENGDLLNNIRPDKICYDQIDPSDIIDVRKSISVDVYNDYHLNKALKQLMTGSMQTKLPETVRRIQFGREAVDYSENNGTILHVSFDDASIISDDINGTSGILITNESNYTPVYRDSVSGLGIYMNGRFSLQYDVSELTSAQGTIDFYVMPYWDGATDIIQNIFQIIDVNGNPMFVMYKNGYQLIVDAYLSTSSATEDTRVEQMVIDLTQILIFSKRIYTIRFSWNNSPAVAKIYVYINGNIVGQLDYLGSSLLPSTLIFGDENDATLYADLELPEEVAEIEEEEETEETIEAYTQSALAGETALVPGEVFIDQSGRPIYTDKNVFIFVEEKDLNSYELSEEYLRSHITLSSSIYNETVISNEDDEEIEDTDSTIIVAFPFQEMGLAELSSDELTTKLEGEDTLSADETILAGYIDSLNSYWTDLYNDQTVEFVDEDGDGYADNIDDHSQEMSILDNEEDEESTIKAESNYAPEVISRIYGDSSLLTTEVEKIQADEARKLLRISEEEQTAEQEAYEQQKLLKELQEEMLENINYGFILEEVAVYKDSKEIPTNDGMYHYTANSYWPGIPNDFIANKALIYPSFNSLYRGYSDNTLVQNRTVKLLTGESGVFTVSPPYKSDIPVEPTIFHSNGQYNSDGEIVSLPGQWKRVKDDWIFYASDTTLETATVMFAMSLPPGKGGEDLPNEIIAAGYVNATDIVEEISFQRMDVTDPRPINYLNPAKVSAESDYAYDYSMTRTRRQAYARLLYYHMSGTGTNKYEIPCKLYGYPVLNIVSVTNRDIANVQYVPDSSTNPYYGFMSSEGVFVITLTDRVAYGDIVEFVIALGGTTFDYETQTKTLVTNLYRTVLATVTADGNRSMFIIPLGSDTGGIIHAANAVLINNYDDNDEIESQEYKFAAYVDNELYPYRPIPNDNGVNTNNYANQLAEITIEPTSWGTPFLKFEMDYTPAEGTVITVPVLVSYQPPKERVISLWYKYVPYQGILGKATKKLKRLTDWKYFITTLSSGRDTIYIDEANTKSLNNIINRLPGGQSYASLITGSKIIFGTDLTNLDFVYSRVRNSLNEDGYMRTMRNNNNRTDLDIQIDDRVHMVTENDEINVYLNYNLDEPIPPVETYTTATPYNVSVDPNLARINGSNVIGDYSDIEPYLKPDANYELRFIKDVLFSSEDNDFDNAFFELDTNMDIYRITTGFQDERLNYSFNSFKTYLPDTAYAICKYTGMACLVSDEEDNILLFVIGCINNGEITQFASAESILTPMFGDLFYLEGRPTSLIR